MKKIYAIAMLLALLGTLPLVQCSKETGPLIGVRVPIGEGTVNEETPYVIHEVVVGSPAHRAGLLPNDVIVQIDTTPLAGLKHGFVHEKLLLGERGSAITIVVDRQGETKIFQFIRGGE